MHSMPKVYVNMFMLKILRLSLWVNLIMRLYYQMGINKTLILKFDL